MTLKIPPGTQPESLLRVRGKGLPEFGGKGRGDLYLRMRITVPERIDSEEKRLYERLREISRKK